MDENACMKSEQRFVDSVSDDNRTNCDVSGEDNESMVQQINRGDNAKRGIPERQLNHAVHQRRKANIDAGAAGEDYAVIESNKSEETERKVAGLEIAATVPENGTDVDVLMDFNETVTAQRTDNIPLDVPDERLGGLAMDLKTSTEILEREACMTAEGLALSERREKQQTSTKIYTGW